LLKPGAKTITYGLLDNGSVIECSKAIRATVVDPVGYAVHLRLIGKLSVDFLLVIIELFAIGVTTEAVHVNSDWKSAFL